MHKVKLFKKVPSQLTQDEIEFSPIPRRRAERRRGNRRDKVADQQGRASRVRKIQGFDDLRFIPLRLNERRQTDRRKSKPNLLSADELIKLRKC